MVPVSKRRMMRGTLLVAALTVAGGGQVASQDYPASPDTGVYKNEDVDSGPARVSGPALVYPPLLKEGGIEGVVTVAAVIDTTGHVERGSVKVVASTNPGFNENAIRYFRETVFRPGRVRGRPVRVMIHVPVYFRIPGR
jgi:TonB family protein